MPRWIEFRMESYWHYIMIYCRVGRGRGEGCSIIVDILFVKIVIIVNIYQNLSLAFWFTLQCERYKLAYFFMFSKK